MAGLTACDMENKRDAFVHSAVDLCWKETIRASGGRKKQAFWNSQRAKLLFKVELHAATFAQKPFFGGAFLKCMCV